jgi:hypothetical protein
MGMPERIAEEVTERLQEAVHEIRELVKEVSDFNKRYDDQEERRNRDRRVTYIALAAGVISVVSVLIIAGFWLRLRSIVDQNASDRQAGRVASCQYTNSNNERTRLKFVRQNEKLLEAFPQAGDIIAGLDAVIPLPSDEDRDCDGDGWLTGVDYQGNTVPPVLPIEAKLSIDDPIATVAPIDTIPTTES